MPLSKRRMAERKRADRYPNLKGKPELVCLADVKPTTPMSNLVKPNTNEELEVIGRILHAKRIQSVINPVKPDVPVYNPRKHHEGDVVRKWSNGKWIEVTVPALDMDGNVIGGE